MGRTTSICIAITIFLVLGGVAVLIAWSVDNMKNPSFTINQASINDYSLNPDNRLTANFTLVIRSHNRDPKYTINYNSVMVAIFHDTYSLAYVPNLGPYVQGHGEDLVFTAQPSLHNSTIVEPDVVTGLRNETKLGQLRLEVRIRAYVKFHVKGWKHKRYVMAIVCTPLSINLDSGSGKSLGDTNCSVDRF